MVLRKAGGEAIERDLSIIVPLYNEEDSVAALHGAIGAAVGPLGLDYEVLFVDDASRDATAARARALAAADPRLRVVRFRRNAGQTAAMAAGIDLARGRVLVTIDGDLQNDPADIPALLDVVGEGYDVVCGWRRRRRDPFLTRRLPSRVANRIIAAITGVPVRDNGCTLKAFRADLIRKIPLYADMHRFLPAMASMAGSRIAEIEVRHHPRRFGRSKYGMSRIFQVLLDLLRVKMLVSFGARPLRWFGGAAAPPFVAGVAGLAVCLHALLDSGGKRIVVLAGTSVLWLSLALFLFAAGVLGELISRSGDLSPASLARIRARAEGAGPGTGIGGD